MPMRMARGMQTGMTNTGMQMRPAHLLMGHAHNAETSDMALTLVATPLMRRKGVRFDASGPLSALDAGCSLSTQPVHCALLTASAMGAAGARGGLRLSGI